MKISIITAVYNRKDTLRQAIESVQSQTYPNIEHIIQDGGSNDGSLDVIQEMSDSRTFCESKSDTGIYNAINRGIARANGDVIGLLHSDDFYASVNVVEKVANALEDNKLSGVYGDLNYVSASNQSRLIRSWVAGTFSKEKLRRGWMPPHPTVFLRREVFEKYGAYNESYKISADYDAMLRYFGNDCLRLDYIPEVLIHMRTGGESNKSLHHIIKKSCEDYRALRTNEVGGALALILKNVSKLPQFIKKGRHKCIRKL